MNPWFRLTAEDQVFSLIFKNHDLVFPRAFVFGITEIALKIHPAAIEMFYCGRSTMVAPVGFYKEPVRLKLAGPDAIGFIKKLER